MNERNIEQEHEALLEELEQFRKEKERIRRLIGQIGGKHSERRDTIINVTFIISIVLLFIYDALKYVLHFETPLPQLFTLELAVLLVSMKIIWMIHKSSKVEHFQFWVLNSIEFRLNDILKRTQIIEDKMDQHEKNSNRP